MAGHVLRYQQALNSEFSAAARPFRWDMPFGEASAGMTEMLPMPAGDPKPYLQSSCASASPDESFNSCFIVGNVRELAKGKSKSVIAQGSSRMLSILWLV